MNRPSAPWTGVEILVFTRTPGLAGKVKDAISPHVERACAFEDFGAAFDHAKKSRAVGFVLIGDDLGDLPLPGVLSQLVRPYEAKGWPGFGALIRTGGTPPPAQDVLRCRRRLLDSVALDQVDEPAAAQAALRRLWTNYTRAYGSALMPEVLRNTLLALAEHALPRAGAIFTDRLAFMLGGASSGTNLSWFELLGARWRPLVDALAKTAPAALQANPGLEQLCALARRPAEAAALPDLIAALDAARLQGRLKESLETLEAPPPLRERLRYCRRRILELAEQVERPAEAQEP